jgi:hypothetical protein
MCFYGKVIINLIQKNREDESYVGVVKGPINLTLLRIWLNRARAKILYVFKLNLGRGGL